MKIKDQLAGRGKSDTRLYVVLAVFAVVAILLIVGLRNNNGDATGVVSQAEVEGGRQLAAKYCGSCHLFPDPALLPKERWQNIVLPVMGLYLGTTPHNTVQTNDVEKTLFPETPVMTMDQWQQLVSYYVTHAPGALPGQRQREAVIFGLPGFDVEMPKSESLYGTTSITSYAKIDTTVSPHRILIGNSTTKSVLLLDGGLDIKQVYNSDGPIVDICFEAGSALACKIGRDVVASDLKDGAVIPVEISGSRIYKKGKSVFEKLARPVQVQRVDLDLDGKMDYVISQFGNLTGELTWMKNQGAGTYSTHIISPLPGALRTVIDDDNKDGLPDIWAQFSQGEEGIFLFTNRGNGVFERKEILRFPPTYGSSSFELIDFDKDGDKDIVYTCGDNGDYSRILKPYHGVYIYQNDGNNRFSERYFYPLNGCYKALSRDFDQDGDLDIAAVSYFPSAATPWEAFVYLENQGGYQFTPFTLPKEIPFQKGVTMDAADLDGDGRVDLVLGNGYYTSNTASGHKEPLFIVLKNRYSKK